MDVSAAATATFAVVRAVHLIACLLLLGVWVFDRLIFAPTAPQPADAPLTRCWRGVARWQLLLTLPIAIGSAAAWFALVAMNMNDSSLADAMQSDVLKLVALQTEFGHAWIIHSGALALSAVGALAWWLLPRGRAAAMIAWLNAVVGAVVVATIAWAGHGATGPAPAWHRAADVLHLLICALWPAGLLPLLALLVHLRLSAAANPRWLVQAVALVQRFSAGSLLSVSVLVGTGIINSWCLVGSWQALVRCGYGRLLLLKISLFLLMLMFGAANLLIFRPRLQRASRTASHSESANVTARRLSRSLIAELLLAVLIMAVVGLLGLLPPGRT